MKHRLYYVTGSKGGVGKSIVSSSLIFSLMEQEKLAMLIDTDSTNPDVARAYEPYIPTRHVRLSEHEDSWGDLANELMRFSDEIGDDGQLHVVVNGAARDNDAIDNNAEFIHEMIQAEEFNYDLVSLWVMGSTTDSVDLLKNYLKVVKSGTFFAICNLFFGGTSVFDAFEKNTELRKALNAILYFPELNEKLARKIRNENLMLTNLAKSLEFGQRIIYKGWLSKVGAVFSQLEEVLEKSRLTREQVEQGNSEGTKNG